MGAAKTPKEKVLHTRVPEALDAQIKALADALRVPVSSLVRHILEDSVAVIDTAAQELDQTLEKVTQNMKHLSARARVDQEELRRGWSEFQTILSESFRAKSNGSSPSPPAAEDASTMFPEVLGWQTLTLNVDASCSRCERALAPGAVAHLGVRERPGPRVMICSNCLPERKE